LERRRESEAVDATADALAKFYFEAGRAFGVGRTEFYT